MSSLISVVVSVYNIESYLDKCIKSIVNQTYTNLEILLIDDGSEDKSFAICDNWALNDNRIKVIHKDNGGLSSARNTGIDNATGRYICFIDGDDYISSDMIEKLYNVLISEDSDISACLLGSVDKDGNFINKGLNYQFKKKTYLNSELLNELFSFNGNLISVANKLFKTELFNDIRFPLARLHEDWGTVYKLYYFSKSISCTNEVLYYYVIRENSIMRSINYKNYYDSILSEYEMYKFFNAKNIDSYNQFIEFAMISDFKKFIKNYSLSSNFKYYFDESYLICSKLINNKELRLMHQFPAAFHFFYKLNRKTT